jgi:hypothetical protein
VQHAKNKLELLSWSSLVLEGVIQRDIWRAFTRDRSANECEAALASVDWNVVGATALLLDTDDASLSPLVVTPSPRAPVIQVQAQARPTTPPRAAAAPAPVIAVAAPVRPVTSRAARLAGAMIDSDDAIARSNKVSRRCYMHRLSVCVLCAVCCVGNGPGFIQAVGRYGCGDDRGRRTCACVRVRDLSGVVFVVF